MRKDRATGAVSSLWWPRRPLATLGRKPRQGRKAATVSIDAGAEVSRRGYHPSTTTNDQPRSQAAAAPTRKQQPSRRVIRSGRGDGIEIRTATGYAWRGQPAGLPPFYDDERSASIAGSGCAYKKATATPACHSFRPWRRHRDPRGGRLCLARSAGGVTPPPLRRHDRRLVARAATRVATPAPPDAATPHRPRGSVRASRSERAP